MNEGNTHELYYKDGSEPTHATDGTKVSGGSPVWGRYEDTNKNTVHTATQVWNTQNTPENRYYWIVSSMDIAYKGASWYRAQFEY